MICSTTASLETNLPYSCLSHSHAHFLSICVFCGLLYFSPFISYAVSPQSAFTSLQAFLSLSMFSLQSSLLHPPRLLPAISVFFTFLVLLHCSLAIPLSIILLYFHRLCFCYHLLFNYIGCQSHLPGFSADTPLRFLYVLRFNLSLRFLHYLCFMLVAFVLLGAFYVTFWYESV